MSHSRPYEAGVLQERRVKDEIKEERKRERPFFFAWQLEPAECVPTGCKCLAVQIYTGARECAAATADEGFFFPSLKGAGVRWG